MGKDGLLSYALSVFLLSGFHDSLLSEIIKALLIRLDKGSQPQVVFLTTFRQRDRRGDWIYHGLSNIEIPKHLSASL